MVEFVLLRGGLKAELELCDGVVDEEVEFVVAGGFGEAVFLG